MPKVKTQSKGRVKPRKPKSSKAVTTGFGVGGRRVKAGLGKKKGFGVQAKKW